MKKFTTLVLVIFLFVGVTNAQLRFGIKGGINVSSLSTTSSVIDQVKAASSYQAGVLMQIKIGSFAFQPEVLYSIKGGDLQDATAGSSAEAVTLKSLVGDVSKIDYESQNIDVPLNLQYGMDFGPARIYAQAGPYVSFLLGAALNGDTKLYDSVDKTLKFNTYDWGIGLGAGAELFGLQLAFKYDFGMKPVGQETIINSQANTNVNSFNKMKNRNLNISLAYLF